MRVPLQTQLSEMEGVTFDSKEDLLFPDHESPLKSQARTSSSCEDFDEDPLRSFGFVPCRTSTAHEVFITVDSHESSSSSPSSSTASSPPSSSQQHRHASYDRHDSLTPDFGQQTAAKSLSNLCPLEENLDFLCGEIGSHTGRYRSLSHVTPMQSTPDVPTTDRGGTHDEEVTPPKPLFRATSDERSPKDTNYAKLDIGPTMRLPQNAQTPQTPTTTTNAHMPPQRPTPIPNAHTPQTPTSTNAQTPQRPTTISVAKDKHHQQPKKCMSVTNISTHSQKPQPAAYDSLDEGGSPSSPMITKHSFNFNNRRSINLYSPLKSITGSRSLSDILTASQKSNSLIRYQRSRGSQVVVSADNTPTKHRPLPKSTQNHCECVFHISDSDDNLDEEKSDVFGLIGPPTRKLPNAKKNKSTASLATIKGLSQSERPYRSKQTSASLDNFLSVCTAPSNFSPREEELDRKERRSQTSPCRMENVFTFGHDVATDTAAAPSDNNNRSPLRSPNMKPIQRQKAVEISKSLDSCLSESGGTPPVQPHPSHTRSLRASEDRSRSSNSFSIDFPDAKPRSSNSFSLDTSEGRPYRSHHSFPSDSRSGCDFTDSSQSGRRRTTSNSPKLLSITSVISECTSPGGYDSGGCSQKFIHKLARRFSIKRKRGSKEKKGGSNSNSNNGNNGKLDERRGSCPTLTSAGKGQRKSLEGEGHVQLGWDSVTDSDRSSTHELQNESLYRGVVRCLLHPLGATDHQVGLRPGDLLDHARKVFDVGQTDHEHFIRDEIHNKPTKVQVSITIVEAKDLTLGDKIDSDTAGVCCILTLAQPSKSAMSLSPRQSPRVSPKTSPKSSPKHRKSPPRSPSLDGSDVVRTNTCKSLRDPKWNECFQFDLDDLTADELHICLCHHHDHVLAESFKQPEKVKAFNGFLKYLRQGNSDHDNNKCMPGAFGRFVVHAKDIPVEGCDKWFDIHPISSWTRSKAVGQVRLQIAVSGRHADSQNSFFSAEDYHLASLLVHKHAASEIMDAEGIDLNLSAQSRRILNIFATSNGISKLSQKILDLTVALELACTRFSKSITDTVLHRTMEEVQMTWCAMQGGAADYMQRMPLCDAEICLYRSATRHYIEAIINDLPSMPSLFPPCVESIHTLKYQFGISLHLLELDLWESTSTPQRDLANAVINKLQSDVREWMESNLETVDAHVPVKDYVIPQIEAMVNVTHSLVNICVPLGVVEQFYAGFGVKYYRIVSFEIERRLSAKVRELMMGLDKYQKRYHNFKSNLETSCRLSIKLYFAVGSFFDSIKENFSERDLFRLSIPSYQDWFEEAVVFWLQMFRTECAYRIQKALEIDKDFVLVTSLVKYSNSSVDAQTCFSEIASEWRQIDIKNPDTAVMGVTKITDMICDGARLYASNIKHILNRNCYYDKNEGQFEFTDRTCITLNNIEHVRTFLSELPERLDMEKVTEVLSCEHEDNEVGKKAFATLRRLINTAQSDILHVSANLLNCLCDKMSVELQRNMELFLVKTPEKSMATDKLISYLHDNLEVLTQRLSETIFPHMESELWTVVIQLFNKHVLAGKPPEYYEHMKKHLRALTCFFQGWCQLDEGLKLNNVSRDNLRERLEINSWKTEQLMRQYFTELSSQMTTPLEYLGHLALKAAYMEETRGNITIYVKVIQGTDLPGLDSSGLSDPYVVVTLQPDLIFCQSPQRTRTQDQTLQPVFNTTFQFHNIPKECLTEKGNCILLSVMDRDHVTTDDFAGEVLIAMETIQPIGINETVDKATAIIMPLKRPQREAVGAFQVLEERSVWDKAAKKFVKDRMRYIENQRQPTDSVKDKLSSFFKFWSKPAHAFEDG